MFDLWHGVLFVWENFLIYSLVETLKFLTRLSFNNLGLGIIALTAVIRLVLTPFTLPSIKAAQKQKELSGQLKELKVKYKDDKKSLAQAQMDLFKKHGINPAAGCLPQIVQIVVLIALYQVFIKVLGFNGKSAGIGPEYSFINTHFLYLDLLKRDPFILLPGLAGASQFLMTKMMLPMVKKEEKLAKETQDKNDDLMYSIQEQMLYLGPVMTVVISWNLPSGLVLYWLATTVFSIIQQGYFMKNTKLQASSTK